MIIHLSKCVTNTQVNRVRGGIPIRGPSAGSRSMALPAACAALTKDWDIY